MAMEVTDGQQRCVGFEQLNATTAMGLASIPTGAKYAYITAEADIRWRADGEDPTSGIGCQLPSGGAMWYSAKPLSGIKFIGGKINVSYFAG